MKKEQTGKYCLLFFIKFVEFVSSKKLLEVFVLC